MKGITKKFSASSPRQEKGAALFVSLVFLFILTIIGLMGMQSSSMQEKMAGNMRDRNLAFQAAESALRVGEENIHNRDPVIQGGFICNNANDGLYSAASPGADCPTTRGWPSNAQGQNPYSPEDDRFWTNNTDVLTLAAGGFNNLAAVPRYVMEDMSSQITGPGTSLEAGNAMPQNLGTYYRVTSRGVGMANGSLVIMQSVVRY